MPKEIKTAIIILLALSIVALVLSLLASLSTEETYDIGNYGVTIKVPDEYIRYKNNNDSQLLFLKNKEKGITISATQLRGNFWSSGDMSEIMNEYASLISIAQFDSSVTDIDGEIQYVGMEPIGIVEMTVSKNVKAKRAITVLTPKTHGYLAIEIYGNPEDVKENIKEIRSIINTIKFKKNTHNYSLDVPKEITPEEELEGIKRIYDMLGIEYSGDLSGELLLNALPKTSGEQKQSTSQKTSGE